MKYMILIIGVFITDLMAMKMEKKEDIDSNEVRINMGTSSGNGREKHTRNRSIMNNNNLDNELQDMEHYQSSHIVLPSYQQEHKTQFVESTLSHLPFFEGKDKEEINEYMSMIKKDKPIIYGQIIQAIVDKKKMIKNRPNISSEELQNVDQKIQHGLLQVALENQTFTVNARKEDLAQARRDRIRSVCMFVTSLALSVPALVLSIININKGLH